MAPSFSLEYYDRIFGHRSAAYGDLLEALAAELADYAVALPVALRDVDLEAVSRLRHAHRPMVENLRLSGLLALEDSIREALEAGRTGQELADLGAVFYNEAQALASALTSARLRDGPGPR